MIFALRRSWRRSAATRNSSTRSWRARTWPRPRGSRGRSSSRVLSSCSRPPSTAPVAAALPVSRMTCAVSSARTVPWWAEPYRDVPPCCIAGFAAPTCVVHVPCWLGLDPWRLGGEMWAFGSRFDGLCSRERTWFPCTAASRPCAASLTAPGGTKKICGRSRAASRRRPRRTHFRASVGPGLCTSFPPAGSAVGPNNDNRGSRCRASPWLAPVTVHLKKKACCSGSLCRGRSSSSRGGRATTRRAEPPARGPAQMLSESLLPNLCWIDVGGRDPVTVPVNTGNHGEQPLSALGCCPDLGVRPGRQRAQGRGGGRALAPRHRRRVRAARDVKGRKIRAAGTCRLHSKFPVGAQPRARGRCGGALRPPTASYPRVV